MERDEKSLSINYPTEKLAAALKGYMSETGLERFAVLGHGPGACTLAMYVAATEPKQVSHLVLINPRSAGSKYRQALENVRNEGRRRRNSEVVNGVGHTFVKDDGTPTYEPADDAELGGLNRALFNLRFGDPTAPEVYSIDYLYTLSGGVKVMADNKWSMHRIFKGKAPRLPVLVCMGVKDPWTPVGDMEGVASFFKADKAKFNESAEYPFLFETYAFTVTINNFFTKNLPKKRRKK